MRRYNYFQKLTISVVSLLLVYCGPQTNVDDTSDPSPDEIRQNEQVGVSVGIQQKGALEERDGLLLLSNSENDYIFDIDSCLSNYGETDIDQDDVGEMKLYEDDRDCEAYLTDIYVSIDGNVVLFSGSFASGEGGAYSSGDGAVGEEATFTSSDANGSDVDVIVSVLKQFPSQVSDDSDNNEALFGYEIIRKHDGESYETLASIEKGASVEVEGLRAPEYSLSVDWQDTKIDASGKSKLKLTLTCTAEAADDECGQLEDDSSALTYYWLEDSGQSVASASDLASLTYAALTTSDIRSIVQNVDGDYAHDDHGGQTYILVLRIQGQDSEGNTVNSYQVYKVDFQSALSNG